MKAGANQEEHDRAAQVLVSIERCAPPASGLPKESAKAARPGVLGKPNHGLDILASVLNMTGGTFPPSPAVPNDGRKRQKRVKSGSSSSSVGATTLSKWPPRNKAESTSSSTSSSQPQELKRSAVNVKLEDMFGRYADKTTGLMDQVQLRSKLLAFLHH
jgi:hypothetical protein